MKRPIKILLTVVSVIALVLCVICIFFIVQFFRGKALNDRLGSQVVSGSIASSMADPNDTTRYMSIDVDFDELQAMNDDIYAWLEIPGTAINFAVVQSADSDSFYLNHGVDKAYYTGGSIFSQRYNTKTFQDPVTVLYGHTTRSQTMFTQLNNFADASYFEENRSIFIYTPDKVYEYAIFAAGIYSSDHLLLCNDFSDPAQFTAFFDSLPDGVNCNYRRELFPSVGDKVLVLSTCYRRNVTQRFLVQGVLTAEYTVLK